MNSRSEAVNILLQVIKEGQSLTQALESALTKIDSHKDRAFIQALCYGVLRDYFGLEFILQQLTKKPFRNKDQDIKVLLLTGLFQLRSMRVKPHAAVSETVSATKKSWARSVVNGVLRQFQRQQNTLEERLQQSETARYSHPEWLIRQIKHSWPESFESVLQENNCPAPMVLRVSQAKISRSDYLQLLDEQQISAQAFTVNDVGVILHEAVSVDFLPGFSEGLVSVQDGAAQLAAELLDVQKGNQVLDMCAAPGGKTAAILEREPQIDLLALDIDEKRLQKVRDNLKRLQLTADCLQADASSEQGWADNRLFDRILLDAPCSALGVIRRHPDIKLLRRESDIEALVGIQAQMLTQAWMRLRPGGVLLYATCSLLKQENEQQIVRFLEQHKDAEELPIIASWGQPCPVGRQILPGDNQMDGFYYARLAKRT